LHKPKLLIPLVVAVAMFALGTTAFASNANDGNDTQNASSITTLDACGYFTGIQTPIQADQRVTNLVTYTKESGTWTGVTNNYVNTPVVSLGPVSGRYHDSHSKDAAGNIAGTERFRSAAGNIDQVYAYTASTHTWRVSVVATDRLSFLTSDTNGQCYTGPFPRP
jgi:hypothetical protein